jgi:SAM-dependent methyltransferase
MSDRDGIFPSLTDRQLDRIARRCGGGRGPILDVGCGQGDWLVRRSRRGQPIQGLDDHSPTDRPTPEGIHIGSAAASIPFPSHSFRMVLLRGTAPFERTESGPEVTIALANLLSCLKPKGRLVIPLPADRSEAVPLWTARLHLFPVRMREREITAGWLARSTLVALILGAPPVRVLEFRIGRKPISRLEWHRLAREAILGRSPLSSEAA